MKRHRISSRRGEKKKKSILHVSWRKVSFVNDNCDCYHHYYGIFESVHVHIKRERGNLIFC